MSQCSYLVVLVLCASATAYRIVQLEEETRPFTYYDRAAWHSENATDIRPLNTPVPYVVIHHTYIPAACYTFDQCSKDMRSMQKYHMSQDWGDIGYNFCVGADGAVYEGRGWTTRGIHAGPANGYSVGICLIGDWRKELPPEETLAATQALIKEGLQSGYIHPEYKLIGHNQAMMTECPGTALLDNISKWDHYVPGHIDFKIMKATQI